MLDGKRGKEKEGWLVGWLPLFNWSTSPFALESRSLSLFCKSANLAGASSTVSKSDGCPVIIAIPHIAFNVPGVYIYIKLRKI